MIHKVYSRSFQSKYSRSGIDFRLDGDDDLFHVGEILLRTRVFLSGPCLSAGSLPLPSRRTWIAIVADPIQTAPGRSRRSASGVSRLDPLTFGLSLGRGLPPRSRRSRGPPPWRCNLLRLLEPIPGQPIAHDVMRRSPYEVLAHARPAPARGHARRGWPEGVAALTRAAAEDGRLLAGGQLPVRSARSTSSTTRSCGSR